MVLSILSRVCSIFVIVGIGVLASRWKLLPEQSTAVLSKYLFNIVTPCMVVTTMQGQTFEGQLADDAIWSLLSFTLATLVVGMLSFILIKPFHAAEQDQGIYRMQLAFTNVGFMGIPLATAVFGERSGLLILLMNTPFIVLLYSLGVFLMLYQKDGGGIDRTLLRRMINIPLVASLLGLVILVTGFRVPAVISDGLQMVTDTMVPAGMLIVGLQLGKTGWRGIFNGRNLGMCLLSLGVVPLLTLGICKLLPQSDAVSATLVFAMAMPSGTLCTVLAEEFGRNTRLASEMLAATTLGSLCTLPVWAVVLARLYTVL